MADIKNIDITSALVLSSKIIHAYCGKAILSIENTIKIM